jgi:hypothetical protein
MTKTAFCSAQTSLITTVFDLFRLTLIIIAALAPHYLATVWPSVGLVTAGFLVWGFVAGCRD